jgi:hypothetical protein
MSYEVNCKLMEVQSEQSGEGKNGRWVNEMLPNVSFDAGTSFRRASHRKRGRSTSNVLHEVGT